MLVNNIKPSTIEVTNKMLVAAKDAHRKYDEKKKRPNEEITVKEKKLKLL